MTRKRVKARRSTPRRRTAPRWSSAEWTWATALLLRRCAHRCERCGHPLTDAVERHHRQRRQVGGDRLANLMALHPSCHQWITEHPEEAMTQGWIVSTFGPGGEPPDPATVPVHLPGLTGTARWFLCDDGTKRVVP